MSKSDSKIWAFLAVLLTVIGFILALLLKKDDRYVMYYGKQGLVLFIGFIIAWGVGIVPIIGDLVSKILQVVVIILWIIAMVFSLSGKLKPTPLIGELGEKIRV